MDEEAYEAYLLEDTDDEYQPIQLQLPTNLVIAPNSCGVTMR